MDERKILESARKGDDDAFSEIVKRKKRTVFWTAYGILGEQEEARDITQKVFIKVWRNLRRYNPEYPFDTWLKRIAVNECIDTLRKRKQMQVEPIHERSNFEARGTIAFSTASVQERALLRDEIEKIFKVLSERLSPKQRAVFNLKELEDLSTAEIARVMNTSESTVRNHLFQARKTLRKSLRTLYPEYFPGKEGER
jgi:RNA polymerase sigma-70 factor (ECF subfamily)